MGGAPICSDNDPANSYCETMQLLHAWAYWTPKRVLKPEDVSGGEKEKTGIRANALQHDGNQVSHPAVRFHDLSACGMEVIANVQRQTLSHLMYYMTSGAACGGTKTTVWMRG